MTTSEFNQLPEHEKLLIVSNSIKGEILLVGLNAIIIPFTFQMLTIEVRCEIEWSLPIVEIVAV